MYRETPEQSLDSHPDTKHTNISTAKCICSHIRQIFGTNEYYKQVATQVLLPLESATSLRNIFFVCLFLKVLDF